MIGKTIKSIYSILKENSIQTFFLNVFVIFNHTVTQFAGKHAEATFLNFRSQKSQLPVYRDNVAINSKFLN